LQVIGFLYLARKTDNNQLFLKCILHTSHSGQVHTWKSTVQNSCKRYT